MNLWLVGHGGAVKAVRGLRDAYKACGEDVPSSGCQALIQELETGGRPILFASVADDKWDAVAAILEEWDVVWRTDEQLEAEGIDPYDDPEAEDDDEEEIAISLLATQYAMILMAAQGGDPQRALIFANTFGRVSDDPIWEETAEYMLNTFPGGRE